MPERPSVEAARLPPRLALAPDVVLQAVGDEAVMLKLHEEVAFALNSTGARVAQLLSAGEALDAIVGRLSREYDVPSGVIEPDVRDLVRTLLERGLLVPDETTR
jgi:hypothetical protein